MNSGATKPCVQTPAPSPADRGWKSLGKGLCSLSLWACFRLIHPCLRCSQVCFRLLSKYPAQYLVYSKGFSHIRVESQVCATNAADLLLLRSKNGMRGNLDSYGLLLWHKPLEPRSQERPATGTCMGVLCLWLFTPLLQASEPGDFIIAILQMRKTEAQWGLVTCTKSSSLVKIYSWGYYYYFREYAHLHIFVSVNSQDSFSEAEFLDWRVKPLLSFLLRF